MNDPLFGLGYIVQSRVGDEIEFTEVTMDNTLFTAAYAFTFPCPHVLVPPTGNVFVQLSVIAVAIKISFTCCGVRSGLTCSIIATMPDTAGLAIDVPLNIP